MNPTVAIEADIKMFVKEHPEQILTYQGRHRTMRYAWSGDPTKRPLLFIHGSPGSWEGWSHFLRMTELQKEFHIIAVDRPGYGGSTPGQTELSLTKQAEDILEVLKFNRSRLPAILIGHSYGGPVIAQAAILQPDKIAGLVFVAASVDPSLEKTEWYQTVADSWPLKHLIPTNLRVCNEEIMALKSELEAMKPNWHLIRAKTVMTHGLDDTLVPVTNVDFIEHHLPAHLIVKISKEPATNHFIPWKRPELIRHGIAVLKQTIDQ